MKKPPGRRGGFINKRCYHFATIINKKRKKYDKER